MSTSEPVNNESSDTKVEIKKSFGVIRVRHSLQEWYKEYHESTSEDILGVAVLRWMKAVDNDLLDKEAIEEEIETLKLTVQLSTDGNCGRCQDFIDILWSHVGDDARISSDAGHITVLHYNDFCDWESSRRSGCNFCKLIMQPDVQKTHGDLVKYQKLQYRLSCLGLNTSHTLSVHYMTPWMVHITFESGQRHRPEFLTEDLVAELIDEHHCE
tara:strand:+ start:423 stop:1061 length:639 start_codon:yes stop_codon:yes gene_type:complete